MINFDLIGNANHITLRNDIFVILLYNSIETQKAPWFNSTYGDRKRQIGYVISIDFYTGSISIF